MNSDTHVPARLHPPLCDHIDRRVAEGGQWTEVMDEVARALTREPRPGIGGPATRAEVEACLASMPVFPEVLEAIRKALESPACAVHVVSDANTVYIETFLHAHGILGPLLARGGRVVTNHAAFESEEVVVEENEENEEGGAPGAAVLNPDADVAGAGAVGSSAPHEQQRGPRGRRTTTREVLRVRPYVPASSPHGCARCPVNLCKGAVMDSLGLSSSPSTSAAASTEEGEEVRQLAAAAGAGPGQRFAPPPPSQRVLYVGDGGGDLCACLRLGPRDVVLARDGLRYPLLRKLRCGEGLCRARVVPCNDGAQMRDAILAFLADRDD